MNNLVKWWQTPCLILYVSVAVISFFPENVILYLIFLFTHFPIFIKSETCFASFLCSLLYSLGYKVLYASGYAVKGNNSFKTSTGHAWSLIKLSNNKWYPFDSTWGIFSGKLPLCHVFGHFNNNGTRYISSDCLRISHSDIEGKFIDN